MRVVHVCLCGPVTDGLSYQDNLLPKYHKHLGYDVSVITSKIVWGKHNKLELINKDIYENEFGIKTVRLDLKNKTAVGAKIKRFPALYQHLSAEQPDVLFIHGCQFWDIRMVVKYLKKHPNVTVFVDNHADFSNSATNFLSKNILHKIVWKSCAKKIEPYTTKFYGVLPARVDFLTDVYGLPKEKCELLVMGADDEKVIEANDSGCRKALRRKYAIADDDFLVITGGKIDSFKKQTLLLMQAVLQIKDPTVKLIVFGSVSKELEQAVQQLSDGKKVQYVGWINSAESYQYFAAADLTVFPGRHSVFWEQVAGQGVPMLVKYWDGTTHVDLGGNCRFLYQDSVQEIKEAIEALTNHREEYDQMKACALEKGMETFSYQKIAKRSIGVD